MDLNHTNESDLKTSYLISLKNNGVDLADDFIELINDHWFKYEPPTYVDHSIFATIYSVFMIFGLPGNAFVIYVFCKNKSVRTPANILTFNLAICDLFIVLAAPFFIVNSIYGGPYLGKIGCNLYGFFGGFSGTNSIITLAIISFDRLDAVRKPLVTKEKHTKKRALKLVLCSWTYSAIFPIVLFFDFKGLGKFAPDGYLTSCGLDYLTQKFISKIFILIYAFAAYFIPLSVIFICYCRVGFELRTRQNIELSVANSNHNIEKRVARTVFFLIFMWLVSWTPYAVLALCSVFGIIKEEITPFVSMWPAVFCKSVSCINPWIYAFSNPKFKDELPFCSRNTSNVRTKET